MLDAPRTPPPSLRISHDARFVFVDGRRVELSHAEAALLSCLIAHGGEPVSRARLGFALRSASATKALPERAVDFAIRRLRLKIEPTPACPRLLLTVRGKGYRFRPPPRSEARARRQGTDPEATRRLARALSRPGGLVQLVGGLAPVRSGLVRAVVDELGGAPPGGVLWIPGRFCDADDLMLAVAAACGPELPSDLSLDALLRGRAPTLLVVDALVEAPSPLLQRLARWRSAAPHLNWVVITAEPFVLDRDAILDLGAPSDPEATQRFRSGGTPAARVMLAHLLASPGPIDIDLLSDTADDTALDELDRSGLVRVSGRGSARRATLLAGAEATVSSVMAANDLHHGAIRSRQVVSTLVPPARGERPWELMLPERDVKVRAVRHHPLLMAAVDTVGPHSRMRDLELAVSALTMMSIGLPHAMMGAWLRARGTRLLERTQVSPQLNALAHLALASLAVPMPDPVQLGIRGATAHRIPLDPAATAAHLDAVDRIAETRGLDALAAASLTFRARLAARTGDPRSARSLSQHALLVHQACGDQLGVAATRLSMAEEAVENGATDLAVRFLAEVVARLRGADRAGWASHAQAALGSLSSSLGDDLSARHHLDAALVFARERDDLAVIAVAASAQAVVEARAGQTSEAMLRRRESMRAAARLGDPRITRSVSEGVEGISVPAR